MTPAVKIGFLRSAELALQGVESASQIQGVRLFSNLKEISLRMEGQTSRENHREVTRRLLIH